MKNLAIFIFTGMVLNSCGAQSDFDLKNIKFLEDKITEIAKPEQITQTFPIEGSDIEYAMLKNAENLSFYGTNLRGRQNPDSKRGINGIHYYYHTSDSLIYKYEVYIYSEEEAVELLATLKKQFGEQNFTRLKHGPEDKSDDNFKALLWERQAEKVLYMLEYTLDETIKAKLIVHHNFEDIVKLNMIGAFGYWEDYLKERKKKNDPNYTYQNFLSDELANNPRSLYSKFTR